MMAAAASQGQSQVPGFEMPQTLMPPQVIQQSTQAQAVMGPAQLQGAGLTQANGSVGLPLPLPVAAGAGAGTAVVVVEKGQLLQVNTEGSAAAAAVPYRLAAAESWTDEEQAELDATLHEYPSGQYSIMTQCAKVAAKLPNKTIRDVGARIRSSPDRKANEDEDFSRRIEHLLRANVDVISRMRENLHKIDLLDNIPLMREFDRNVAASFALLRRLDAKMPPFPVRVNTMYLTGPHQPEAFDTQPHQTSAFQSGTAGVRPPAARHPTLQHPATVAASSAAQQQMQLQLQQHMQLQQMQLQQMQMHQQMQQLPMSMAAAMSVHSQAPVIPQHLPLAAGVPPPLHGHTEQPTDRPPNVVIPPQA